MIRYTLTLGFALVWFTTFAQSGKEAKSKMNDGKLLEAIQEYSQLYKTTRSTAFAYELAKAYALTYQIDSAFKYIEIGISDNQTLWPLADFNFYALLSDDRWSDVEKVQFERFEQTNGALLQPEFARQLLRLIMSDQSLDYYIDLAKVHFMQQGSPPHWYFPLGAYRQEITKDNFGKMEVMIEQYGWPTYSSVGEIAADGPLLVINHHEDHQIRVKYLERIKGACLKKEGSCVEYAKIQDRILVDEDKPQMFGMQFRYNAQNQLEPFPVDDPQNVDKRRSAIGLEPLADYLKRKIDYDWVVE